QIINSAAEFIFYNNQDNGGNRFQKAAARGAETKQEEWSAE
ncbi:MAG: hypothetical protein ACI8RD_002595, partial [Bacillariaceae sp.]